jgi:hypothetical protein
MSFNVSFECNEDYECGAALLTVLACPKDVDENTELYQSLCGKALWLKRMLDLKEQTPITAAPQYVFRDRKYIDKDVRIVEKRLGERMVAARMAVPFLRRAALGSAGPLPKGIQRLSINQMAEFVLVDEGLSDTANVKKRIWTPSRPVIHLAAAAAIAGQWCKKAGEIIALESFLFRRELTKTVVRLAQDFETVIANDPKFPVKPNELVRFRLG